MEILLILFIQTLKIHSAEPSGVLKWKNIKILAADTSIVTLLISS